MTDDEIREIWLKHCGLIFVSRMLPFARAIIAADRAQREPMQNDEVDAMFAAMYPAHAEMINDMRDVKTPREHELFGRAQMLQAAYRNGFRGAERAHGIGAKDD